MLQDLSFEENYEKYHDEKLIKSMNITVKIYSMLFHLSDAYFPIASMFSDHRMCAKLAIICNI